MQLTFLALFGVAIAAVLLLFGLSWGVMLVAIIVLLICGFIDVMRSPL